MASSSGSRNSRSSSTTRSSSSRAMVAGVSQPLPALTQTDQENLHFMWKKMVEESEECGLRIIIKFFADYPETKPYFKNIPTEGNLQNQALVILHGRKILEAMNQVFENIGNWHQARKVLESLAERHKNTHQVPLPMFQAMFRVMLSICEDVVATEFTDEMLISWEKFFGAVYEEVAAAYSRT